MERSVIRLAPMAARWKPVGHPGHLTHLMQTVREPLRRAERGGGEPGLAVWRLGTAAKPDAALEPHRHPRLRSPGVDRDGAAAVKTRLGLMVRGVTQNRRMASCGASTRRALTPWPSRWAPALPAWLVAR